MTAKTALCVVLSVMSLAACGGDQPPPKAPEPAEAPSASQPPPPATAEAAPAAAATSAEPAPAAAPAAPPAQTIKETIGTVTKIEVMEGKKKKSELTKAADVEAFLKAVGTEQVPSKPLRKCPDDLVVVLKDKDDVKGNIGVCKAETLGAEFFTTSGGRKGFDVADETAVKKALKLDSKPAPASKK